MRISIIIPTLQAEKRLPTLIENLKSQNLPSFEIIIVDTFSTDDTKEIAQNNDCQYITIKKDEFSHGKARNLGSKSATGDILIFLTQDALPADGDFLNQLTLPIQEGIAAATTGRQLAYPNANPIEAYSREFNYPKESKIRTIDDLPRDGVKTFFFSNSASAIHREIFDAIGGFAEELIVDEDLEFCARLLYSGGSVKYCAEAQVYHSHNYTITSLFQRFFDIGVFFSQSRELLAGVETNSEGLRYLLRAIVHLTRNGHILLIPRLLIEVIVKFVGFKLGFYHDYLPPRLKPKLSGQKYFWEN